MTSKIKVDNIENQCGGAVVTKCGATTTISGSVVKADDIQAADGGNIINQCGTTITLGASGDTINLASGASQSGFGRTGTVDWQTSIKTSAFTAVSGEGYFVNTTSGAITMTLPASPSVGDIVSVKDYASTFNTNALTIGRNGSNFNGGSDLNPVFNTEGQFLTFIYADATKGWLVTDNSQDNTQASNAYIAATGGTVLTCGNFKTHVFTGPGTFCVTAGAGPIAIADYFVVAGGGGNSGEGNGTGAGGAGGFRVSNGYSIPAPTMSPLVSGTSIPLTVGAGPYSVAVGGGGAGTPGSEDGTNGAVSTFSTITSAGGGSGNRYNRDGAPGGSGGGAGGSPTSPGPANPAPGGSGNTPPVSPPQGNNGGRGYDGRVTNTNGGGGGGAGGVGTDSSSGNGGNGGAGSFIADAFIGPTAPSYGTPGPVSSTRYFAGGGAGSTNGASQGSPGGAGGGAQNTSGTANTGGGSGGGGSPVGKNGGSGIVMIRYRFQA